MKDDIVTLTQPVFRPRVTHIISLCNSYFPPCTHNRPTPLDASYCTTLMRTLSTSYSVREVAIITCSRAEIEGHCDVLLRPLCEGGCRGYDDVILCPLCKSGGRNRTNEVTITCVASHNRVHCEKNQRSAGLRERTEEDKKTYQQGQRPGCRASRKGGRTNFYRIPGLSAVPGSRYKGCCEGMMSNMA